MNGKKSPAQQDQSLAAKLTRWRHLAGGVQRNLGDLDYAAANGAQLEKLAEEILCSTVEQRALTQRLRALVREREAKVQQARDLRNRLAAAVVGRYGPRSSKLREFGLKPKSGPRRKAPQKEVRGG